MKSTVWSLAAMPLSRWALLLVHYSNEFIDAFYGIFGFTETPAYRVLGGIAVRFDIAATNGICLA
jgi:hypothetical protein